MPRRRTNGRVSITLVCTACNSRNYETTKKRGQVIELKKYCRTCGKHCLHREAK